MTTKRRAGPATGHKKTGTVGKHRASRGVLLQDTAKTSRKSAGSTAAPAQHKRGRKLIATVEPSAAGARRRNRDWTMVLRGADGRFVGLVIGSPGFVLDAQRAALTGGVRALQAFPEGGCADG